MTETGSAMVKLTESKFIGAATEDDSSQLLSYVKSYTSNSAYGAFFLNGSGI